MEFQQLSQIIKKTKKPTKSIKDKCWDSDERNLLIRIKLEEFPGGLAVKDVALSLLWLKVIPCPGNFHRLQA